MKKFILLLFAFISCINVTLAQGCEPTEVPIAFRTDPCGGSYYWFTNATNGVNLEWYSNAQQWVVVSPPMWFVESGYPHNCLFRLSNACGPGPQELFYLFGYGPPGLCDAPTNIADVISNNSGSSIFPNPAATVLNVKTDNSKTAIYKIKLYDMLGKLIVNNVAESGGTAEIDVSGIENGIYSLYIDKGIRIQREKITIAH